MGIYTNIKKIYEEKEKYNILLEVNYDINYDGSTFKICVEPRSGKHHAERIKVITKDKGKSVEFDYFHLTKSVEAKKFVNKDGNRVNLSLNNKQEKILKRLVSNNYTDFQDALNKKINADELEYRLLDKNRDLKINNKKYRKE